MTTIEIAGQLTAGDRYRLLNCSSKEAELKSGTSRREFVKGAKPPAAAGRMSLEPKLSASRFQCFWPAPGAWGSFELTRNALTLTPLVGTIQTEGIDDRSLPAGGARQGEGHQRREGDCAPRRAAWKRHHDSISGGGRSRSGSTLAGASMSACRPSAAYGS